MCSIKDDRVAYIGDERPQEVSGREIDGKGRLLMSGFFNAHAHSPMTLMRGYGENMVLQDWLTKKIFPFEDKLDGRSRILGQRCWRWLNRSEYRHRVHQRHVLLLRRHRQSSGRQRYQNGQYRQIAEPIPTGAGRPADHRASFDERR